MLIVLPPRGSGDGWRLHAEPGPGRSGDAVVVAAWFPGSDHPLLSLLVGSHITHSLTQLRPALRRAARQSSLASAVGAQALPPTRGIRCRQSTIMYQTC